MFTYSDKSQRGVGFDKLQKKRRNHMLETQFRGHYLQVYLQMKIQTWSVEVVA